MIVAHQQDVSVAILLLEFRNAQRVFVITKGLAEIAHIFQRPYESVALISRFTSSSASCCAAVRRRARIEKVLLMKKTRLDSSGRLLCSISCKL